MRKLLLIAAIAALFLPACGKKGGTTPTPVTTQPAPPVTQPPQPTPIPVANVTGFWDSEARRWHYRLVHSGSNVSGQLLGFRDTYFPDPNASELAIRGTVSSTGAINFSCAAFGLNFSGRVESSTRITGTLFDCGNGCRNYGDIMLKVGN